MRASLQLICPHKMCTAPQPRHGFSYWDIMLNPILQAVKQVRTRQAPSSAVGLERGGWAAVPAVSPLPRCFNPLFPHPLPPPLPLLAGVHQAWQDLCVRPRGGDGRNHLLCARRIPEGGWSYCRGGGSVQGRHNTVPLQHLRMLAPRGDAAAGEAALWCAVGPGCPKTLQYDPKPYTLHPPAGGGAHPV